MNSEKIRELLDRLGRAVSASDLKAVASCWELPAMVLLEEGAIVISDAGEIEKFFARAAEGYKQRGLTSTKAELGHIDGLSDNLAAVDARWPAFDASGQERASETSHYIVQLGKDGQARIRVALTKTQ